MLFRLTMKTPDALQYAIEDATDDPKLRIQMEDFASQYVSSGEYLTVEFDTEKKTCVVVKKG
jgi:hypothetical protein